MTENGLFVLGGPSMMEKTMVEARARKISGEFPVTVGGRGPSDARFSRTYARVCEALRSN